MRVLLLKSHTHAGEQLEAGKSIEVDESTAKWLAHHKVIADPATAETEHTDNTEDGDSAGEQ